MNPTVPTSSRPASGSNTSHFPCCCCPLRRRHVNAAQGNGVVTFYEYDAPGAKEGKYAQWVASGGEVVIESVSGTSVRLRVVNATVTPDPADSQRTPTGTFTLNVDAPVSVQ